MGSEMCIRDSSQAGADAMEREQGSEFRELLKYYFQGIEIVKIAE